MDHPDRVKHFLQRVDWSLDQFLTEEKTTKKAPRPKSGFLSQEQIDNHYDDHYLGYLKGLEKAQKLLKSDPRKAMLDIAFNYNGALLHEIYFDCMGGKDLPAELVKILGPKDQLISSLKDAMLASKNGWAYLGYDCRDEDFKVGIIDSHDCHVALWCPVLALDVWEHAYYIDFKADKKKYVEGMIEDINWEAVAERVEKVL